MNDSEILRRLRTRRLIGLAFQWCCLAATVVCVVALAGLMIVIVYNGIGHLSWNFLTSMRYQPADQAGVKPALVGSIYLILLTAFISVPVGVASAVYLVEYASDSWWMRLVRLNIANLAGVPSIVYGILGLALFVRWLALGRSLLAGALTLSLVILPIIIIASREALRAVPDSLRHASLALGATRGQTIWRQVLPMAAPGIMTGVILSLSRALGEAAPLVVIGAATYISYLPANVNDSFTALPIRIFDWSKRPQHELRDLAASAIIVLLVLLFVLNATAVFIRYRFSKRLES